ncbi:IPT/TIG domain-containing protein [Streptomyces antimycoticus]|uniref:IPT/TIG domain-containing protein n=2 Tax=Streptomyces antimycoticus TaxID=68175 RepID=UPI0033EA8EEE|nr:IPT/TIG domain-containing protein [Streptomyces antimycoticus]
MAPVVTSVSPAQGNPAGGTSVTINGSSLTSATVVRFGSNLATNVVVVSDTQITATTPPGSGTAKVTVTTPGGTSTQNVLFTYTTAPAPTITSLSPSTGPAAGGNSVIVSGTNLSGAVQVLFGSTPGTILTSAPSQVIATAPAGTGTVNVTVTTPNGTSNPLPYTYTPVPAPTLTNLNPTNGPTAGGNTITITGTNLTGTTQILFGTNPATTFTINSPTQITATAPPGTGTVNVTATTPNGTSNPLPYTYTPVPAPTLTNLNPTNGPTAGGNTITITGTNLTGTTQILFGTNPATTFTINSPTQITATAPAGPASAVNVTVTTPGGTSNPLPYIYVAAPTVASVSPQFGPAAGGTTVIITGSNLALATQVHFGPNLATGLTVVSDTQLTVTAPAGTGTVVVTVTTPGGTSTVGLGIPYYTYLGAPVINALIPNNGTAAGGDSVTIGGSNLIYTDSVTFGGTPASFTVFSDTIVVATTPAHAAGTVNVQLHTPAGNSNTFPFTYDPA